MRPIYLSCFQRDGWKCRHCNDRSGLHPHHIIFQSHQGPDELNNLITLCAQCHMALHADKLEMTVLDKKTYNVVVSFKRLKGWKPQ